MSIITVIMHGKNNIKNGTEIFLNHRLT